MRFCPIRKKKPITTNTDPWILSNNPILTSVLKILAFSKTKAQKQNKITHFKEQKIFFKSFLKTGIQFSPNLTLGERVNLFNTRMKYFDNPGFTSPGNVGWNQIKVTWWPELNSASPVAPTTNVDGAYTTKINNENVLFYYEENFSIRIGSI